RHREAAQAEGAARALAKKIEAWLVADQRTQTTMIGPVPCFFAKMGGYYRWQIVLRGPEPESLLGMHLAQLKDWRIDVGPVSLL
ncbi:MAG: hypothetical protein GXP40_02160, partial [Chloroflexi bacterium]|nr:hypothetical protein [Chloroflexota bacterium]